MEELIKTANIYYNSSSVAVQNEAKKFFREIDHDNDEKVCLHEFIAFLRDEGHVKMGTRHFFKSLDGSGTGTLDFMEVMALYYILKSGRPFCHGCGDFIPGMYFTCSKCYQNSQKMICLCPDCFDNRTYTHEHNQFLDNFALLEIERMQRFAAYSVQKHQHQVPPTSSVTITELPASTSVAVVPYQPGNRRQKWRTAFNVLGVVVSAANAVAYCAVM